MFSHPMSPGFPASINNDPWSLSLWRTPIWKGPRRLGKLGPFTMRRTLRAEKFEKCMGSGRGKNLGWSPGNCGGSWGREIIGWSNQPFINTSGFKVFRARKHLRLHSLDRQLEHRGFNWLDSVELYFLVSLFPHLFFSFQLFSSHGCFQGNVPGLVLSNQSRPEFWLLDDFIA